MLIDFSFSNFRSFRDEQSFSMTREKRFMESDESLHSPIAAIYGANASGKSNFLKALRAMRNMVVNAKGMQAVLFPGNLFCYERILSRIRPCSSLHSSRTMD